VEVQDNPGIGPAFAIFAGGGARSIAHVAALKAAVGIGAVFRGYAGTSGGAIVAALAAVGYSADEMFDPRNPGKGVFTFLESKPVSSLFDDWARLTRTRSALERVTTRGFWRSIPQLRSLMEAYKYLATRQGVLKTDRLRTELNTLLRRKLLENRALVNANDDYVVRFSDINIKKNQCADLKVVATCINTYEPWVFSSFGTPDVAVADAVIASAAIPFVFSPITIDVETEPGRQARYLFVDGGLASNLPVWLFRDERLREERIFTKEHPDSNPLVHLLAFSLSPDNVEPTRTTVLQRVTPLSFFLRIARLTLQSSQSIIEDFVEGLTVVDLPSGDLDVLDFDRDVNSYRTAYRGALEKANDHLQSRLQLIPRAVDHAFYKFADKSSCEIRKQTGIEKIQLRYCAITPVWYRHDRRAKPINFRVTHTYGFERDADDRLLLDEGNAAPTAFILREAVVFALGHPNDEAIRSDDTVVMTRYEAALVRPGLRSVFAWPVFEEHDTEWNKSPEQRKEPLGVLSIDSDEDLSATFLNKEFSIWLINNSSHFGRIFRWIRQAQERN
jgi:NTE family protein